MRPHHSIVRVTDSSENTDNPLYVIAACADSSVTTVAAGDSQGRKSQDHVELDKSPTQHLASIARRVSGGWRGCGGLTQDCRPGLDAVTASRFTIGFAMSWLVVILLSISSAAIEPETTSGMLSLRGGDYVAGKLVDSKQPDRISWQHPQFASPFEFFLFAIVEASFPTPGESGPAAGNFVLELVGGDRLFGSITDCDEQTLKLNTADFGELSVSRRALRRIFRWRDGDEVIVSGPGTLKDWKADGGDRAWQDRGGQLRSERAGALLYRDVELPLRSRIQVELAWEEKPNFVLAIGVDQNKPETSAATAFRIEAWEDQWVAVWELDDVADVAVIGNVAAMNEHLRLTIELDQQSPHALVLSQHGELLAEPDLRSTMAKSTVGPGIWIENIQGVVKLDALNVMRSNRVVKKDGATDQDIFYLKDGKVLSG